MMSFFKRSTMPIYLNSTMPIYLNRLWHRPHIVREFPEQMDTRLSLDLLTLTHEMHTRPSIDTVFKMFLLFL